MIFLPLIWNYAYILLTAKGARITVHVNVNCLNAARSGDRPLQAISRTIEQRGLYDSTYRSQGEGRQGLVLADEDDSPRTVPSSQQLANILEPCSDKISVEILNAIETANDSPGVDSLFHSCWPHSHRPFRCWIFSSVANFSFSYGVANGPVFKPGVSVDYPILELMLVACHK